MCREAGARATTNTRDLNAAVSRFDDRRIEVIANGLPLRNGAQLAVDTTIVSPLTDRRAFTEIMYPGGECGSAYKGASQDLSSRLRLVAQMSSPRTCSKKLFFVF